MKHLRINDRSGFTIIELLIATTVFSVILLLATGGLLTISNTYYKGYITSQTQGATRNILTDLSQTAQFNSGFTYDTSHSGDDPTYIKIGKVCYTPTYDTQMTGGAGSHALVRDTPSGGCPGGTPDKPHELIGNGMRLRHIKIQKTTVGSKDIYTITVMVIYGPDDVLVDDPLNPPTNHTVCAPGPGQRFCAVSELSTSVQQRV